MNIYITNNGAIINLTRCNYIRKRGNSAGDSTIEFTFCASSDALEDSFTEYFESVKDRDAAYGQLVTRLSPPDFSKVKP